MVEVVESTNLAESGHKLVGPSSLSSREHDDSCDFVVINGSNSSANGFPDPEQELFSSLSQADAVAQLKEVLQQRDLLHSKCL